MKIFFNGVMIALKSGFVPHDEAVGLCVSLLGRAVDPALVTREGETPAEKKALVRDGIAAAGAGDVQSMLGTTSDIGSLMLCDFMALLDLLENDGSNEPTRTFAAATRAKYQPLYDKVQAGEVIFPHQVKNVADVMAEAETRGRAVVAALTS